MACGRRLQYGGVRMIELRRVSLDRIAQVAEIGGRFARALFRRPWSWLLRRGRLKRAGLQFERDRLRRQCQNRMPSRWRQFHARTAAQALGAEARDGLDCALVIEYHQYEQSPDRKDGFGLGIEGMPVRADVAVASDRIQEALTRIFIILMNIEVLPLPWRRLRLFA